MGLFDYLVIEAPIEGVDDPSRVEWQTKAFDNPWMLRYRITADGRLLEPRIYIEDRSDPNAAPGSAASFAGCMTPVYDGWDDMNYHGDVDFVGGEPDYQRYVARFTHGQLESIRRLDDSSALAAPLHGNEPT